MNDIGYCICARFDPSIGERWTQYIAWSGFSHLEEVISLDCVLCPSLFPDLEGEDWNRLVYGRELGDTFNSLEYLVRRRPVTRASQVLAVVLEPTPEEIDGFRRSGFSFKRYDLLDAVGTSALLNCAGLGQAYLATDLSPWGLMLEASKASDVRAALPELQLEECHAHCDLWAIWRLEDA